MTIHIEDQLKLKRTRLAIFAFYFMQGLCFSSWASRIPDIKMALGLNDASWGTILLMIPIGQICGMTLSGFLVSRLGSKRILPIALVGYVITLILIGLTRTEGALMVSLLVFGFFGNFCNISVNTQGLTLETMYNKPIMASFHGGWSLAGLTGAAIGLILASINLKPVYHFLIIAFLVLIGFIINIRYLQSDIKKKKDTVDAEAKKTAKPEVFLYLLGIVAFCGMAAEGAMSDWSGLFLTDVVGVKENLAPIGLTAYMVTMATGRFVIDKATQRFGRLRVLQCGGLFISVGLFFAVAFPNLITTLIAFMIIGVGTAGIVPTVYSVAGQKTKISTGIALTIVSSVSFLGFLMGPPLIGYVSHATNLRVSYAIIGIFGLCIIALSSKLKVLKEK